MSSADQVRLDAYYAAVRTAEQELNEAGAWLKRPKPVVVEDQPTDIPDKADLIGRIRLLFNMVPLILETDSSRVISIMIQDHGVAPQIQGVSGSHHNLSHHGQDEAKIDQLKKIEARIIGQFDGLGVPSVCPLTGARTGSHVARNAPHGFSPASGRMRRQAAMTMRHPVSVFETIGA